MIARRVLTALAWGAVALTAFRFHPALREGAPLAGLGREIAGDAAQGGALLKSLGLPGSHVSLAFWALVSSLTYLAVFALFRLNPPDAHPAEAPEGREGGRLLVLALLGSIATLFAHDATGFYFLLAGVAALFLIRPRVAPGGLHVGKTLPAMGVGLVLVLLASVFDAGLAQLTGAPVLPEAWFPLAVEFSTRPVIGLALAAVVAAACLSLSLPRIPWIALAPACTLVLGPSNPAKGIAMAAVLALLSRAGAGPGVRAVYLLLATGLMTVAALAL